VPIAEDADMWASAVHELVGPPARGRCPERACQCVLAGPRGPLRSLRYKLDSKAGSCVLRAGRSLLRSALRCRADLSSLLPHTAASRSTQVWEREDLDERVCARFMEVLDGSTWSQLAALWPFLTHMLAVPDSLQRDRIDRYLSDRTGLMNKVRLGPRTRASARRGGD
jgi:hypothetical protein